MLRVITAPPDAAPPGDRLDRFLAVAMPDISRSRIQALMKAGRITVDGRPAKPREPIIPGARIEIDLPPEEPITAQPQDIPLKVLFEDEHLAVIDKPCGMVVHPGSGRVDATLVSALLHRYGTLSTAGGDDRPGIVHRLDKDTSGCLVIARTDAVHRALAAQFAGRRVDKTYLAVTDGVPRPDSGMIETRIGRSPRNRQKMTVLEAPAGKPAVTGYHVEAATDSAALVVCRLFTGRTHQIRVHLKSIGCPIAGDPIYGRGQRRQSTLPTRLMLHAWKLAFTHPITSASVGAESPPPPEFQPWLERGRR